MSEDSKKYEYTLMVDLDSRSRRFHLVVKKEGDTIVNERSYSFEYLWSIASNLGIDLAYPPESED